jgi:hypothetical protein
MLLNDAPGFFGLAGSPLAADEGGLAFLQSLGTVFDTDLAADGPISR